MTLRVNGSLFFYVFFDTVGTLGWTHPKSAGKGNGWLDGWIFITLPKLPWCYSGSIVFADVILGMSHFWSLICPSHCIADVQKRNKRNILSTPWDNVWVGKQGAYSYDYVYVLRCICFSCFWDCGKGGRGRMFEYYTPCVHDRNITKLDVSNPLGIWISLEWIGSQMSRCFEEREALI